MEVFRETSITRRTPHFKLYTIIISCNDTIILYIQNFRDGFKESANTNKNGMQKYPLKSLLFISNYKRFMNQRESESDKGANNYKY